MRKTGVQFYRWHNEVLRHGTLWRKRGSKKFMIKWDDTKEVEQESQARNYEGQFLDLDDKLRSQYITLQQAVIEAVSKVKAFEMVNDMDPEAAIAMAERGNLPWTYRI